MTCVYEVKDGVSPPSYTSKVTVSGKAFYVDPDLANAIKRLIREGHEDSALKLVEWFRTRKG